MANHLAAVAIAKGQPFEVQTRPTPKPGPGELLIAVKAVALNPVDGYMRNMGLFIPTYPTTVGLDIAGLVLEVGDNVPTGDADDDGVVFQPGITRVAGYGASLWKSCDPDYGSFQERCIVPWQHAVPLPESVSWNQAATLPMAVEVGLNAWDTLGILRGGEGWTSPSKEALLIWGASSSVGTMGVQSARLLREDTKSPFAAVYATAGAANHKYVSSLGADRVFDHKEPQVVDAIISAAKEDGLVIRHCFYAAGQLGPCQAVLNAFVRAESGEKKGAKIAAAPYVPPDAEKADGVEVISLLPSTDEEVRLQQFRYWMGTWLRENLAKGLVRPSPEPTVVGKGLEFINAGIDKLSKGVSCTKLVVEVGV
ncbi:GroES-like protein [Xylaria sp. FL0933]|nr:GroES-like protein [Xylaria sp. FL0933]